MLASSKDFSLSAHVRLARHNFLFHDGSSNTLCTCRVHPIARDGCRKRRLAKMSGSLPWSEVVMSRRKKVSKEVTVTCLPSAEER